MKKKLVASLAAAMVMSVAGTSFAATNPFTDVPAKHWAYDAVKTLSQAGIMDGLGNGQFAGDKTLTRYEIAQIVAKAMANSNKADAAQKASIDKLAAEFASELEGLGVRVTNVENKLSALDKVSVGGAARLRFENNKQGDAKADPTGHINLDLNYGFKVNDTWSIKGESEWNRNLKTGDNGASHDTEYEQLYVAGSIKGVNVKAGRYSYATPYGLGYDDKVNGAQASFGDKVKVNLNAGRIDENINFQAAEVATTFGNATVKAAYTKVAEGSSDVNNTEVGFSTSLTKDFSLTAAYATSSNDDNNKGYFAKLQYKAADTSVVGSNDIFAHYYNEQTNVRSKGNGMTDDLYGSGFKGVRVGFDYVPTKNAKATVYYSVGTDANDGSDADVKNARAQIEFSF